MKRTLLCFGASLVCATMGVTAFAQTDKADSSQSQPQQTEPKADQSTKDDSAKALTPTGRMIKESDSMTIKATVEDIDPSERTVTLKGEGGKTVTVKCGDEVRNFDQIKKGDQVTAKYYQSIALGLRKSDEPPSAEEERAVMRAEPGQKPGAVAMKTVHVNATIESIDRATREVTLKGADGKTKTVKVPDGLKNFDSLKKGDQVVATVREALALAVSKSSE